MSKDRIKRNYPIGIAIDIVNKLTNVLPHEISFTDNL